MKIAVGIAALLIGCTSAHGASCEVKDFTIKNMRSRQEYGHMILTATVTNNSSSACGVQIKASTYDKGGAVVETNDFWPASIRNIAPGGSENFKAFLRSDKTAKTFDMVPIDTRVWKSR